MEERTEELEPIGGDPHNAVQLRPIRAIYGEDVPAGGYVAKVAKSAKMGELKVALAAKLAVPEEAVKLAYEGEDINEEKTLKENGVSEPGPSARRAGAKVNLMFMVADGVELGVQRSRREAEELAIAEQQAQAEENERLRKLQEEERIRIETEQKAMERKLQEEQAQAQRQEEALQSNRCVIRCAALGGGGGQELVTASHLPICEVAKQLCRELGMLRDDQHAGGLLLLFNGQPLHGRQTLADAGVRNGDEVMYFWGDGGTAAAAEA